MEVSWVVLSVDKVLADSQHREHLRPVYKRGVKPSRQEVAAWSAEAIHDSPVMETLELIRVMIAQGYHILLTCGQNFPVKQWFERWAPDISMNRVARVDWEKGLTYDAKMLTQLRQLRDNGDTVFMSITASSQYMATVRYLFPKAITSVRTPDTDKAVELRREGNASKLDKKYPAAVDLTVRYFGPPVPDPEEPVHSPFNSMLLDNRWINVDGCPV